MGQIAVRLLNLDDLPGAERASDVIFLDADLRDRRVSDPEPQPRSTAAAKRWIERMRYFLDVDPEGCWVAMDGADVVGFAISQNRDRLWYLATYGVLPSRQGQGIGRRLMDAALAHADGRPGLFSSTVHPGATRRYRLAGFSLFPQMRMVGTVDRAALPAISGLRAGGADDFEWMDRLDERLRGAGHGPDHRFLLADNRLVVSGGRGYVYVDSLGRPSLLAAADREVARKLLWEALAASTERTLVNCITTANEWAVDVGLAARLDIGQEGYLALRGLPEPAPYLASGHFL
ncbi:MAG TPA: GNAT family N-acetyltransferase [Streptosporangiaceae bacterium]